MTDHYAFDVVNDEDLIAVGINTGLKKAACGEMLENIKENAAELSPYIINPLLKRTRNIKVDNYLKDLNLHVK